MYFVPHEGLMENNKEKQQKSSDLLKSNSTPPEKNKNALTL